MALARILARAMSEEPRRGVAPAEHGRSWLPEILSFFPLQPELVATAHIIPVGQGTYRRSGVLLCKIAFLPDLHVNWDFRDQFGEENESGTLSRADPGQGVSEEEGRDGGLLYLLAQVMEQNLEPRNCSAGVLPQYCTSQEVCLLI